MEPKPYIYNAFVTSVYDGDSITANINLGFSIKFEEQHFRLEAIDAPEIRGGDEASKAAALASREFLRELVSNKPVLIETVKDKREKYGRYLATLWLSQDGVWVNVNDLLVKNGHAVYRKY